jgi:hypothetical protein
MDSGGVRRAANQPVERIDFAHKVSFAKPADSRIAAHRADCGEIETDQSRACSHPRGHCRRLAACMAAAYNHDVKASHRAPIQNRAIPVKD